jgi:hypothetical protein
MNKSNLAKLALYILSPQFARTRIKFDMETYYAESPTCHWQAPCEVKPDSNITACVCLAGAGPLCIPSADGENWGEYSHRFWNDFAFGLSSITLFVFSMAWGRLESTRGIHQAARRVLYVLTHFGEPDLDERLDSARETLDLFYTDLDDQQVREGLALFLESDADAEHAQREADSEEAIAE